MFACLDGELAFVERFGKWVHGVWLVVDCGGLFLLLCWLGYDDKDIRLSKCKLMSLWCFNSRQYAILVRVRDML